MIYFGFFYQWFPYIYILSELFNISLRLHIIHEKISQMVLKYQNVCLFDRQFSKTEMLPFKFYAKYQSDVLLLFIVNEPFFFFFNEICFLRKLMVKM